MGALNAHVSALVDAVDRPVFDTGTYVRVVRSLLLGSVLLFVSPPHLVRLPRSPSKRAKQAQLVDAQRRFPDQKRLYKST